MPRPTGAFWVFVDPDGARATERKRGFVLAFHTHDLLELDLDLDEIRLGGEHLLGRA